jgi:hypothetical protein
MCDGRAPRGFAAASIKTPGLLLRAGRVRLQGTVPNGQHFQAGPRLVWAVANSTALVGGHDIGPPGPLPHQDRLGDFWLPQRGLSPSGRPASTPTTQPATTPPRRR